MKQMELFGTPHQASPRKALKRLVDRHLAEIAASRALRESSWERAQEIIEQRKRGIRTPLRQVSA